MPIVVDESTLGWGEGGLDAIVSHWFVGKNNGKNLWDPGRGGRVQSNEGRGTDCTVIHCLVSQHVPNLRGTWLEQRNLAMALLTNSGSTLSYQPKPGGT
jgi:hypothetical protein